MSIDLMPVPRQQFFDANGVPLAGGKLYTYVAGTSTPLATYTDISGTIQNSNPVILDSGGFATIWLGNGAYKIIVKDLNNVQQWVVDNVTSSLFGPSTTDSLQNKTLNGPNAFNNVSLIDVQWGLPLRTGTNSDQILVSTTLKANQLSLRKAIRLTACLLHTGLGNVVYTFKLGNVAISTYGTSASGEAATTIELVNTGSGTLFKFDHGLLFATGFATNVGPTARSGLTVDLTVPQVLSLSTNSGAADQTAAEFWMVETIQ